MAKRLKVLVSAFSCIPYRGSEPGVGWNWAKQMARFHEVFLFTRPNHKELIDKTILKESISNLHCVYFDLPEWARFWRKEQRGIRLHYYLWQILAFFVGKRLHKETKFDFVHHVTFGSYWMPSFLILLPVYFIWGPVGGAESTPKYFYNTFSLQGKLYEALRTSVQRFFENDPIVRLNIKKSFKILTKAKETAKRLENLGAKQVVLFSESGISKEELAHFDSLIKRKHNKFRIVSIGRLLHWKGFHLSLKAFASFSKQYLEGEYWFIGDGPEQFNLKRLARQHDIESKVTFWGQLPRMYGLSKLSECDVLVHPSFHDSGGWVCLEAMAAELPVICFDLGGPGMQVTKETGFRIPANDPDQAVRDMSQAMLRLARDFNLRKRMGEAGRKRVREHFLWDLKGEKMNEIYQGIVGNRIVN